MWLKLKKRENLALAPAVTRTRATGTAFIVEVVHHDHWQARACSRISSFYAPVGLMVDLLGEVQIIHTN